MKHEINVSLKVLDGPSETHGCTWSYFSDKLTENQLKYSNYQVFVKIWKRKRLFHKAIVEKSTWDFKETVETKLWLHNVKKSISKLYE